MSAAKAPHARKKRESSQAGASSRKDDITRLVIRALKHEKHPELAQKLIERSGLQGGTAAFQEFEQAFAEGSENVFELAEGLEFRSKADKTYAMALINTERILNMIRQGQQVDAAALLRELNLAKVAPHQALECTNALMADCVPENSGSRLLEIQQLLKPSVVVPLGQLLKLLDDANKYDLDQGTQHLQGVQISTVIVQALDWLGYKDLADVAGHEMGVQLVAAEAFSLQKALAAARWTEALKLLEYPRLFADKADLHAAQQTVLLAAITDRVRVGRMDDAIKLAHLPIARACAPLAGEALLGGRALLSGRELWTRVCALLSPDMVIRTTLITDIIDMALRYQAMRDRYWAGPLESLDSACVFTNVHAAITDNFPSKCMLQLAQGSEVWSLAFRPAKSTTEAGDVLASGNRDGQVTFYDTSRAFEASTVAMHKRGVQTMHWSPDGRYLATGCGDSTISVWDFEAKERKVYVECHTEGVGALCWLADGKHIASAGLDGTFAVWNLQGRVVWRHDQMRIISMALVGDELHALSVGRQPRGQFIYRLDVKNWKYIDSIKVKGSEITSMAYSEQSRDLLFNENPDRLVLVDLKGDRPARFWKGPKQTEFMIRSSFGGPFDKFVASGSEDGHVYVSNRVTGRQVHRMAGHRGTVNVALWCPHRSLIASAGDDYTVRIWAPKDDLAL